MQMLKQSTAITLLLGPFVNTTDGFTPETGLTITQPDVRLSKAGGAFAQKSAAGTATHGENGWYAISLSTTDTDTLGRLTVAVYESGALPVWQHFTVLAAAVYDAIVGNTGTGLLADVQNVAEIVTAVSVQTVIDINAEQPFDANILNPEDVTEDILTRDWGTVGAPADRSVLNALRPLRNRLEVVSLEMIVYEEDDTTEAWRADVTLTASDPISARLPQ